jgi:hypothetical protein
MLMRSSYLATLFKKKIIFFGNDHLLNFLKVNTKLTDHETETTTADEIYKNYVKYIKDNNIELTLDEKEIKEKIGTKLNKLYEKNDIKRNRTLRPLKNLIFNKINKTNTKKSLKKK